MALYTSSLRCWQERWYLTKKRAGCCFWSLIGIFETKVDAAFSWRLVGFSHHPHCDQYNRAAINVMSRAISEFCINWFGGFEFTWRLHFGVSEKKNKPSTRNGTSSTTETGRRYGNQRLRPHRPLGLPRRLGQSGRRGPAVDPGMVGGKMTFKTVYRGWNPTQLYGD